jgi:hypothetical protein
MSTSLSYFIDGRSDALDLVGRLVAHSVRPPSVRVEVDTRNVQLAGLLRERAAEDEVTVDDSLVKLADIAAGEVGRLRALVGAAPHLVEWSVEIWRGPHDWCGSVALVSNCDPPWHSLPGCQASAPGRLTLSVSVVCERQWDGDVDQMRAWISELTGASVDRVVSSLE